MYIYVLDHLTPKMESVFFFFFFLMCVWWKHMWRVDIIIFLSLNDIVSLPR